MASGKKQIQQLARQFLNLSKVDGEVSAEQVAGILQYIEKHAPANSLSVLKAYRRLISAEIARGEARVEHAGPIDASILASIGATMTRNYSRRVTAISRRNDELLAGLRVRVGDDVFESSVSGQLAALATAV